MWDSINGIQQRSLRDLYAGVHQELQAHAGRRLQFEFGIAYETSLDHIKRVPQTVEEAVSAHKPDIRIDRAHFKSLR
jgi:hypothetical protein